MIDVAANWHRVRERVAHAAERAGRAPGEVRIVAISKTQPLAAIRQVIAAGATDIGESYVQEAAGKIRGTDAPVVWHMVGHLQRNKAARAVELFDVVHSVDSRALGAALAVHAKRRARVLRVFIEVNVGGEATKSGLPPDEIGDVLTALGDEQWLRVEGLMTIPPPTDPARPYFRTLRMLRDALQHTAPANAPLRELSMGMTDDFTEAIEEGATIVRIGRAIFGERTRNL